MVETLAEGKPKQFAKARWADGMVAALCQQCAEPGGIDRSLSEEEDAEDDLPAARIASQVGYVCDGRCVALQSSGVEVPRLWRPAWEHPQAPFRG